MRNHESFRPPSEVDSGQETPERKQEAVETRLAAESLAVIEEVSGKKPPFVMSVVFEPKNERYSSPVITISYDAVTERALRDGTERWDLRVWEDGLHGAAQRHNLELRRKTFSDNETRIDYQPIERVIDGKTNWRRWLPYWDKFDAETVALIDFVSTDIGQQEGVDGFEKFARFADAALAGNMITRKERSSIANQMHKVANGY